MMRLLIPCALLMANAAAQFGGSQTVTDLGPSVHNAVAFDLDGDGDLDVLAYSIWEGTVSWFPNDGNAGFGRAQIIMDVPDRVMDVHAVDLDGDGDQDVIVAVDQANEITAHMNLGGGTFAPAVVISSQVSEPHDLDAADLDGDGDIDVLSASGDGVAWYENTGGAFGPGQVLTTPAVNALSVHAADVDSDGDIDVLGGYEGNVQWHDNLGGGAFGPRHSVPTSGWCTSVQGVDFDGDGDQDLLTTADRFGSELSVRWHENIGGGTFVAGSSLLGALPGSFSAGSAASADFDRDGDADVIWYSSYSPGAMVSTVLFAWTENLGNGSFGSPIQIDGDLTVSAICAADMDGDGDADVLTAHGGSLSSPRVSWYENEPRSDFGSEQVLFSTALPIVSMESADIDGDGDEDVVSASERGAFWHEQLGGGAFTSLSIPAAGSGDVYAGDLDGDGNQDVLSLGRNITWTRNLGGGVFAATQELIYTGRAITGQIVDLDGDGDQDVLALLPIGGMSNTVVRFENLGGGVFGPHQYVGSTHGVGDVLAADLDGDGDQDVIWTGPGGGSSTSTAMGIHLAENVNGVLGTATWIDWYAAANLAAGDLDGDGDMDLAVIQSGGVRSYENLGGLSFGPARVVSTDTDGSGRVDVADLDGDGSLDLITTSYSQVLWYRNLADGRFSSAKFVASQHANDLLVHDVDQDGRLDVLIAANGFSVQPPWSDPSEDVLLTLEDSIVWYPGRHLAGGYCAPAVPNSTGFPGRLTASGSFLAAEGDVTLVADELPPNQFGLFLSSTAQGFVQNPGGSQGNLCLSGAIGRYDPANGYPLQGTGWAGRVVLELDLTAVPTPLGPAMVLAGETWNYQFWHRDALGMTNFTDAVSVTFQ